MPFVSALLMIVTPRDIGRETMQSVDARELHTYLDVATPFRDWIHRRIETYGFLEGDDFHAELRESLGGRPAREYALSLAMAKELCMVERGEKGRQARTYFLECERRAKAAIAAPPIVLADMDARLARLECRIAEEATKVLVFNRLCDPRQAVSLTAAAKLLDRKPREFQIWLLKQGWLFRSCGHGTLQAYQSHIDKGLLIHRMVSINHAGVFSSLRPQPLVTPRGLAHLARMASSKSTTVKL